MTQDTLHIWTAVQDVLRRSVGASTFEVWLAPLQAVAVEGATLVLAAPPELRDWVADRFDRPLRAATAEVLGRGAGIEVVAAGAVRTPGPAETPHGSDSDASPTPAELNPKFTFGQFVIGDANRFAHAAALAVAELPGQAYNPLFIYGPPGVGKTHLLHSIGNYVREYGNGLTVRYTTIERFTNEFLASIQKGAGDAKDSFKERYRRADVLLIDDVQFLEKKARTEEEFFHTFNALHDAGSQLVLTSDRLPGDLQQLEDRMRERFEAGLVTDIQAPDLATRMTVLRKRVQHDAIELAEAAALDVIADRIPSNIRALEGALIRVVAFGSLTGRALTADLAAEVLDGLYGRGAVRRPGGAGTAGAPSAGGVGYGLPDVTVARVQELVCEAFSLTQDELLSPSRALRVSWPRQLAMYLAREHTQESLPSIGRSFGGRNHTTVMHAVKRTAERLGSDPEALEAVQKLSRRLTTA